MTPDIRSDPLYDEPVNIDMEPEEALEKLLGPENDEACEEEAEET